MQSLRTEIVQIFEIIYETNAAGGDLWGENPLLTKGPEGGK